MCFLGWFRGMVRGWRAIQMTCTHLGGFLLGGSNTENWGGGEGAVIIERRISL